MTCATTAMPFCWRKKMIDEGNDFNENPVGTGPYKLVEWKHGDQVEFEAFEDYFMGAPAIQHMTWKIIPEGSSRTIALEAGEVDFVVEVEAMDAERIQENPDLTLLEHEATNVTWLMLNNEKPGLDNVNVRHAINCAIDKEKRHHRGAEQCGPIPDLPVPQRHDGLYPMKMPTCTMWKRPRSGWRSPGVDPASIEMSIICSDDKKKRAGEVIQANLKEIGIECGIEDTIWPPIFL